MKRRRTVDGFAVRLDPYRRCPEVCRHELTGGVLLSELLPNALPPPNNVGGGEWELRTARNATEQ